MKIFIILLFYNLDDNCAKIVLIGDRIVATGAGSSWNTDRYFRKLTRHSSIFHRKHGREEDPPHIATACNSRR